MKQRFTNLLNKLNEKKNNIRMAAAGLTVAVATPFAAATGNSTGTTASNTVGKLLGVICKIFFYIGVVLLAWGVGQLVLAFKNEDADSKSRAIMLIISSIVLMAMNPILTAVLTGTSAPTISNDIDI